MLRHIRKNLFARRWRHSAGGVLTLAAYSPNLAPSDYHLFSSMGHALKDQHFKTDDEVEKWVDEKVFLQTTEFFVEASTN